jgi:competence protein ComEC
MILTPFIEDRSRWILWWPVGLGSGISIYFSLPFEPSFYCVFLTLLLLLFGLGCARYYWQNHLYVSITTWIIFSLAIGFTVAQLRTHFLATPFLSRKVEEIALQARIQNIEDLPKNRRMTFDQIKFDNETLHLQKIRLTVPYSEPLTATIGDIVHLKTSLLPLADPVSLNGYNFRRQAYFQGIGATGRVKSHIHTIDNKSHDLWLASGRHILTNKIRHYLPNQTGEIAVALITGDRSGIHPNIRQAFTDAGLAHILAISGLHLTLVAGIVFLIFRRGLALIPSLAENYPIKKWSAILVVLATLGYLAISGFGIPGQRAFVMICIMMLGIVIDRKALSMRLVAIAATIILILRPESLLSASFQLSFAAVVGLIAAYEDGWKPLHQWSLEGRSFRKLIAYGTGLIATTLIATLATTPYTLALFNRITLQAIVGNFLAIPLTSCIIMPSATLCVLTLPIGHFDIGFQILSFGIQNLIKIAQIVASWPGAAILIATPSPAFIGLVTIGGLWICIWKNRWRWCGIILCAFGCLSLFTNQPADIYIAGDGSVIAFHNKKVLYVSDMKRGNFYSDQWMKELGISQKIEWPDTKVNRGLALLLSTQNMKLNVSRQMCQERALFTTGYAWKACKRLNQLPTTIIDRFNLNRGGTHQIWIKGDQSIVKSVRKFLGDRPWNIY